MIKLIREGSRKYPWILKSVVGLIALVFVVTMGWWGFESSQPRAVASVGPFKVSREEFRRAYTNTYRFYKQNVKDQPLEEEMIKQMVLEGLIEDKLWTIAAQDLDLQVAPEELRQAIVNQPDFQREKVFDPELYQRVLAANRLTPRAYEDQRRAQLLAQKTRFLVLESVSLTPQEIDEAQDLAKRQAEVGEIPLSDALELVKEDLLFQKQQRALAAFKSSLKAKASVEINREFL